MSNKKTINLSKTNLGLSSVANLSPAEIVALLKSTKVENLPSNLTEVEDEEWTAYISEIANNCQYEPVTYSKLIQYITDSELVPGRLYELQDYKAILGSSSVTLSKGNFKGDDSNNLIKSIYLRALSTTQLDPVGVMIHNGKFYLVKYDYQNNSSKYEWANSNGRGVIYEMTDVANNTTAPYDFLSISNERVNYNFKIENNSNENIIPMSYRIGTEINPWNEQFNRNPEDDFEFYPTFTDCTNVSISPLRDSDGKLLLNNIVLNKVSDLVIKGNCYGITLSSISEAQIESGCYDISSCGYNDNYICNGLTIASGCNGIFLIGHYSGIKLGSRNSQIYMGWLDNYSHSDSDVNSKILKNITLGSDNMEVVIHPECNDINIGDSNGPTSTADLGAGEGIYINMECDTIKVGSHCKHIEIDRRSSDINIGSTSEGINISHSDKVNLLNSNKNINVIYSDRINLGYNNSNINLNISHSVNIGNDCGHTPRSLRTDDEMLIVNCDSINIGNKCNCVYLESAKLIKIGDSCGKIPESDNNPETGGIVIMGSGEVFRGFRGQSSITDFFDYVSSFIPTVGTINNTYYKITEGTYIHESINIGDKCDSVNILPIPVTSEGAFKYGVSDVNISNDCSKIKVHAVDPTWNAYASHSVRGIYIGSRSNTINIYDSYDIHIGHHSGHLRMDQSFEIFIAESFNAYSSDNVSLNYINYSSEGQIGPGCSAKISGFHTFSIGSGCVIEFDPSESQPRISNVTVGSGVNKNGNWNSYHSYGYTYDTTGIVSTTSN